MKKLIKALSISCMCLCLAFAAGCSGVSNYTSITPYNEDFSASIPGAFTAAQSDSYSLVWDDENARVLLIDKQSGYTWSNVPNDLIQPRYDDAGDTISNSPQIEAPFIVEYYDSESANVKNANAYTMSVKKRSYNVEKIENGIKITYNFKKELFTIPITYTLVDDHLSVSVNPSEITEAENSVYGITFAPFFCSVRNKGNGYLFVPSGSGALIYAKDEKDTSTSYTCQVYGGDKQCYPTNRMVLSNIEDIKLPVFGAVENNGYGCMGIISSGAGGAYVSVNYGNSNIGYSSVFAKFTLRGYQNATALITTYKWESAVYAPSFGSTPVTVDYYPLSGETAGYSGMADIYRTYLEKKYSMKKTEEDNLLNVRFLGGNFIKKSFLGIPYNTMFATTTLTQAQEILSDISSSTGVSATANLVGYGDSGLSIGKIAGGYTVNSSFGGIKQMKKLSSWCNENNIPLYMDFDIVSYSKSGNGVSGFSGYSIAANYRTTQQLEYDIGTKSVKSGGHSYKLVQRALIPQIVQKAIKAADRMTLSGISVDSVANTCYSDYRDQKYFAGGLIETDVSSALSTVGDSGKKLLVVNANDYAAAVSGLIYEAPLNSSREGIFTCDVPFYQMVFKGFVPMTGSSVNLSAAPDDIILHCAETGSGLLYTLSKDYTLKLKGTSPDVFYATDYDDIKESLAASVAGYSDLYESVRNSEITAHEILDSGLRKTVFENGITVYVNYTNAGLSADGVTVPAKSYQSINGQVSE